MENFIIGPMTPWGPFATGFIGLFFAFILYGLIMKYPAGKDSVVKIGDQIHLGAKVFMLTEYKIFGSSSASACFGMWVFTFRLVYSCSHFGWSTIISNSGIHRHVFSNKSKCKNGISS